MIKKIFTLCILICFSTTPLLPDTKKQDDSIGYDQAKKKAIQSAKESKQVLQERFNMLVQHLKENSLTGDKDHDKYLLNAVKQNQKDWLAYQYSTCQSQALIEIYPSTSRLYTQTMNICIAELNAARIKYLNDLMKGFQK